MFKDLPEGQTHHHDDGHEHGKPQAKGWEERFDELFCEKDRGLRTRMKAMNNISMSNGIRAFIRAELERAKAEERKKMSNNIKELKKRAWYKCEAVKFDVYIAALSDLEAWLEERV